MKKIILIEPPYQFFRKVTINGFSLPLLWMMCLSTYLKERMGKNISIEYLDGQILTTEQILKQLEKSKPDFVGLCPKYSSYANALIIARAAKKLGSRVIMGGPHAGPLAKEILLNRGPDSEDYCVDVCIRGDGEKALYEYMQGKDPLKIKNLVFSQNGRIVENPVEYLNLDELPMINRDLIDVKPYFRLFKRENLKAWPVFTHKGCFYGTAGNSGCIFCGGDKKLRLRSPELFWREVNMLVEVYKASMVTNLADALPLDAQFSWFQEFYAFSKLSKKKPLIKLRTLPRFIDTKTVEVLKEWNVCLVRLPVTDFYPGCAFGSLKNYDARYLKTFVQPFELLSKAGITIETYFMPGAFNESREDLENISKLGRLLSKIKNVHILSARGHRPFPGSRGWQMLLKKTGDKYKNKDLINWREVSLDWIKYFSDPKLMPKIESIRDKIPNLRNWR
jgi:radical SAM superfamily enzyme YgiQ (UPF0313 family)